MATTRTQAERSATTRQALLDATIRCLVEEGYANTTTARVAELAGVSRGAHLHHFQTRSSLVAAAVEHLRARRAGVSRGAQQNYFPHKQTLVMEAIRHLGRRQRNEIKARVAAVPGGRARTRRGASCSPLRSTSCSSTATRD